MSQGLLDTILSELGEAITKYAAVNPSTLSMISTQAPVTRFSKFFPHMTLSLHRYEIETPMRQAHYVSQWMHESAEFYYLEEIADGSAYEGRADLGNTEPGDGKRFKGRGLPMLTGRANYAAYSEFTGIDFVRAPELLIEPKWAVDVSGWYWMTRKLNDWADKDDVFQVSRRINGINRNTGQPNGFEERKKYLARAKHVLAVTV